MHPLYLSPLSSNVESSYPRSACCLHACVGGTRLFGTLFRPDKYHYIHRDAWSKFGCILCSVFIAALGYKDGLYEAHPRFTDCGKEDNLATFCCRSAAEAESLRVGSWGLEWRGGDIDGFLWMSGGCIVRFVVGLGDKDRPCCGGNGGFGIGW